MKVEWSPSEASGVNQFLNTPLGIKWLQKIFSLKPKIDDSNLERAALSGAFAAGYEKAWEEISNTRVVLASPESASARAIDPTRD
jgi:hypothetical protein